MLYYIWLHVAIFSFVLQALVCHEIMRGKRLPTIISMPFPDITNMEVNRQNCAFWSYYLSAQEEKNDSRHCLLLIIFLLTKFPNTGSTHFSVFLWNGIIGWSTSKLSLAVCLWIIWTLLISLNCLYYLASFLKCTFKQSEHEFKRISMKSSIPSSLSLYLRARQIRWTHLCLKVFIYLWWYV